MSLTTKCLTHIFIRVDSVVNVKLGDAHNYNEEASQDYFGSIYCGYSVQSRRGLAASAALIEQLERLAFVSRHNRHGTRAARFLPMTCMPNPR